MEENISPVPKAPVAAASFEAFLGFIPPATLRFDGSGAGGLKVKYARVKLPVTPTQSAPVRDAEAPCAVASA